ncbi:MAG: amidohydrolase [Blastocatellia bacterium]|nr:amidohydrolase [Blastocatellia bacterium]
MFHDIDLLLPRLIEIRRDIHQHPELSNREVRTAGLVADFLKKLDLDVQTGVAHHGVVALLHGEQPGPVIGIRADMDALPICEAREVPYKSKTEGVMHACGHDVHTTIGLGTAAILAKYRNRLAGTVKFIFQPAEEGPPPGEKGGAPLMIEEGVLENPKPDVMFGLHVYPPLEVGKVGYTPGPSMAGAVEFRIKFLGTKVHGAYPHKGVDAIVVASQAVIQLQTIVSRRIDAQEAVVLSIGSIHGGNRFNIVADEVILSGTVRAMRPATIDTVEALMRQVLEGVTSGFGARYEFQYERLVPALINDPELTLGMVPVLQEAVGKENLFPVPFRMGAEDFAFFAERIPSLFLALGIANQEQGITAAIHTPEFDVDESCLAVGVKAMVKLALGYSTQKIAG